MNQNNFGLNVNDFINTNQEFKETKRNWFLSLIDRMKNFKTFEWLNFVGMLIFAVNIGWAVDDFITFVAENKPEEIFFGMFDRFTSQSNWILFVFSFMYFFWPNHGFFRNNKFLISSMVYIFFTFIGYNVILVGISGGSYSYNDPVLANTVENVWHHILCPLYFILFGYVFMIQNQNKQPKTFSSVFWTGMIYPTIYVIYIATIPFVYKLADGSAYTVYGNATNTAQDPTSWAYICVMYLIFFPLSFALFYYSWKWLNNIKNIKRDF